MSKSTPSCIIIGTGFSGIAMAIKLKEKGINDFIILEKAKDVGGTWRENTYPGRTMEYMRKTKKVDFNDFNIT